MYDPLLPQVLSYLPLTPVCFDLSLSTFYRPAFPIRYSNNQQSIVSDNVQVNDDMQHPSNNIQTHRSANNSVISLPFLGAIRNVPLSNRREHTKYINLYIIWLANNKSSLPFIPYDLSLVPLRVTNPDQNSILESSSPVVEGPVTQIPTNASLETLVEAPEPAENGKYN